MNIKKDLICYIRAQNLILKYSIALMTIIFAVICTLFATWEIGGETWGYWYFSRVFSESGRFVVLDRSPLYILYLNIFNWIPYPTSVLIEYIVTTCIVVFILVLFLRSYLGLGLSLLASCIWVPYLQMAEPPVQKLALACSLVAVMFRENRNSKLNIVISYSFLLFAYLFRQTYIILLFCFLIYDMSLQLRYNRIRAIFSWRFKFSICWPIILVFLLLFWFVIFQSSSPWNNVWFTDTVWFPVDGKNMASGGGIQNINWTYIILKYGTFENHDFYFTNQEAFGGATNIFDAAIANPRLFIEICIYNLRVLLPTMLAGFWLPKMGIELLDYILQCIIIFGIVYGSIRFETNSSTRILIFASIAMVGVTIISIPLWRYMMPMIPVYFLAAYWYGVKITNFLKSRWLSAEIIMNKVMFSLLILSGVFFCLFLITDQSGKPERSIVLFIGFVLFFFCAVAIVIVSRFGSEAGKVNFSQRILMMPTLLLLLMSSSGLLFGWIKIGHNIRSDIESRRMHLLEGKEFSMKLSYPKLDEITKSCKGIMSLEPLFIGAFIALPLNRVYSPWEIPPFGYLNNSPYKGLNPERVDCVLVSNGLTSGVGGATNIQMRYQNYIKPYLRQLNALGAVTYDIPNFGQAVILPRNLKVMPQ